MLGKNKEVNYPSRYTILMQESTHNIFNNHIMHFQIHFKKLVAKIQ